MYTNQIADVASKHVDNFIGVFPLDKLPIHLPHGGQTRFIVNTDSHNLSGQHWIAVSYEKGGIMRAFDPLGVHYPSRLVHCHVGSTAYGG